MPGFGASGYAPGKPAVIKTMAGTIHDGRQFVNIGGFLVGMAKGTIGNRNRPAVYRAPGAGLS
jgi:hypothetical protein